MIGPYTKTPPADDNRRPPDNDSRRTSPEDYRRPVEDLADEDRSPTNVHPRLVENQTSQTPKRKETCAGNEEGEGVRNSIIKERIMNTKGQRTKSHARMLDPGQSNTKKEGDLCGKGLGCDRGEKKKEKVL